MAISKKDFTEASGKLIDGPGGWKCPCCNPYWCLPRKMKKKARRLVRRKEKMKFRQGVDDVI